MGLEGLHYRDICYLLLQCTLKMQHMPYIYFTSLLHENHFQLEGTTMDVASHTTAILLVFLSDDQHETIEHIHTGLVVHHTSCQLYKQKVIPMFIKSVEDDLKKARLKWAAGKDPGEVCSFSMFIGNFGGLMAVPTDPPYYLMYPNIYSNEVPAKDRNHFNVKGGPSGLCTHACICHALLQHANLSKPHRWKYHGSHLVIPQGAQYSHLLPEITMPHNHRAPLIDLHSGEPFPMVQVGAFSWWTRFLQGCPGTAFCSTVMTSTNFQR